LKAQPAQKANQLRIQSLTTNIKAVKALSYPTFSVGGGLGTNFGNSTTGFNSYLAGYDTIARANAGAVQLPVYVPKIGQTEYKKSFGHWWDGWGSQINNNFGQNIGFQINVPILNGGQARFALQRAKLNLKNAKVTQELIDQTLKNDIYKAFYSASAALQKFNASKTSVDITQKTYDFASKRYELGLLNTYDLLITQNNLTRSKLDMASAQFDYVFKMKVLEFYKGQGIKLSN
jgi:outer membrane protein